ncbi:MAG TPA: LysR family transcriptional regulator [Gemmataceae bacterium]|nr:LysR family transcriptional regulator [Gemmataceae bacterium]
MQLESLKVFCDVARCRSVSQAAQLNRMTQSAASQTLRQLEKHLNVQLIDRSVRPLQLTPLGQHFYERCRELVEQFYELEASIRSAGAEVEATVEVAAIYSVGLGDMDKYVERFKVEQPHARVHIDYLHPDRVYEKVADGTADFGLVSFPKPSRKWEVIPWRDEEMVLACAASHPLAARQSIRPAELAGEKYVAFDKALTIRRQIDKFLREHGTTVEVACELDNVESIKKAVEELSGVALLPEPTLRREVRSGALVALPLSGTRLVRPLGIILRRQHKLGATALRFMDLLRSAGDPHSPRPDGRQAQPGRNGAAHAER